MQDHTTPEPYFPDNLDDYAPWVAAHGLTAPYGKCQCGHCEQTTSIAKMTKARPGHKKGEPVRFIRGHHAYLMPKRPVEERFWTKVNKNGPIHPVLETACWLWTASTHQFGYGRLRIDGKYSKAHRFSYELAFGPIPEDLFVCHHCDNPPCVNPAHLFLGTQQDNLDDMRAKGRQVPPPVRNFTGEQCPQARFTNAQVRAIRKHYAEGGINMRALARLHGVSPMSMWEIIKQISYPDA